MTDTARTSPGREWPNALYMFAVGGWLAVLQVVLFLSLVLLLSSAFLTFVTVTFSWLLGAAAGVWIPRGRWSRALLGASCLAPYVSMALLELAPFQTGLTAIHGLLAGVTALFGGQIYQQERESFRRIGALFFWENNGFVLGLILGVIGFVLFGTPFLYLAPALGLAVVVAVDQIRRPLAQKPTPPAEAEPVSVTQSEERELTTVG